MWVKVRINSERCRWNSKRTRHESLRSSTILGIFFINSQFMQSPPEHYFVKFLLRRVHHGTRNSGQSSSIPRTNPTWTSSQIFAEAITLTVTAHLTLLPGNSDSVIIGWLGHFSYHQCTLIESPVRWNTFVNTFRNKHVWSRPKTGSRPALFSGRTHFQPPCSGSRRLSMMLVGALEYRYRTHAPQWRYRSRGVLSRDLGDCWGDSRPEYTLRSLTEELSRVQKAMEFFWSLFSSHITSWRSRSPPHSFLELRGWAFDLLCLY